jgi:hypothetical protein
MKTPDIFSSHVIKNQDRVKIPVRFAKILEINKSHLVRVNQGKRNLSLEKAVQVVDLFREEGREVHLFDILPWLKNLEPYFCRGCERTG